jgi:beta-N-acetylhexosaminidase
MEPIEGVPVPGSIARGVGAAVATVAVTAAVVAAGTGAFVVYRSESSTTAARPSGYATPSAAATTGGGLTIAPSRPSWTAASSPTPTPSTSTPTPTPADTRLSVRGPYRCPTVASMSIKQALMQTLLIGVSGGNTTGPRGLTDGPTPVGGIVVYDGSGLTAFRSGVLRQIASQSPPPIVAVDDEGGPVQRVDALFGSMPSAAQQAAMTPAALRTLAAKRAAQLASVGVTLNLAPVADLSGPVIGDRSYGDSPADVTAHAAAFAAGMRDGGVLPSVTHFPGYGGLSANPGQVVPRTAALDTLRGRDLVPFRQLLTAGPAAVVVGNVYVPGLSSKPGLPATLDPAVYGLLRKDLGFRGLIITSELSEQAAVQQQYGTAKATVAALAAGADLVMLYHPGYLENLLAALSAAVASGQLPEARVRDAAAHVLAAKGCR